jgi:hypothetical protein
VPSRILSRAKSAAAESVDGIVACARGWCPRGICTPMPVTCGVARARRSAIE